MMKWRWWNKKLNSLGSLDPEHANDEISVIKKVNCLGSQNP